VQPHGSHLRAGLQVLDDVLGHAPWGRFNCDLKNQ
jgi:hypothetical protein